MDIPKTLLIPLWARARATKENVENCSDPFALDVLASDRFDLSPLEKLSPSLKHMMIHAVAVRTRLFDDAVERFISANANPVIINLGCGLDYRSHRFITKKVQWYNVDVNATHQIREELLPEADNIHEVAGGINEPLWLNAIPNGADQNVLLISEGTLMYFDANTVHRFLNDFRCRFPRHHGCIELVGDLAKNKIHPTVKAIGANCPFLHGVRDAEKTMNSWMNGVYVTQVDSLFNYAKSHQWRWLRLLFYIAPGLRYRMGSMLVHYHL